MEAPTDKALKDMLERLFSKSSELKGFDDDPRAFYVGLLEACLGTMRHIIVALCPDQDVKKGIALLRNDQHTMIRFLLLTYIAKISEDYDLERLQPSVFVELLVLKLSSMEGDKDGKKRTDGG